MDYGDDDDDGMQMNLVVEDGRIPRASKRTSSRPRNNHRPQNRKRLQRATTEPTPAIEVNELGPVPLNRHQAVDHVSHLLKKGTKSDGQDQRSQEHGSKKRKRNTSLPPGATEDGIIAKQLKNKKPADGKKPKKYTAGEPKDTMGGKMAEHKKRLTERAATMKKGYVTSAPKGGFRKGLSALQDEPSTNVHCNPPRPESPEVTPPSSPRALDSKTIQRMFGADPTSFAGLGLADRLATHLKERLGYHAPTTVQQQAIPPLLAKKDMMVRAETGSGKTLVYLAPMFVSLGECQPRISRTDGTRGLILVPTRELALQVLDTATKLTPIYHWIVCGAIFGGENRNHEKQRLRKGIVVLVCSPGRLLDHLKKTDSFRVDLLSWLVLDEADRLLDMGFEETLTEILQLLNKKRMEGDAGAQRRQTALLSATLHADLHRLARLSMTAPLAIGFEENSTRITNLENKQDIEQLEVEKAQHLYLDSNRAGDRSQADSDNNTESGEDEPSTSAPVLNQEVHMPEQISHIVFEVPCKLRAVALVAVMRHRFIRSSRAQHDTTRSSHKMVVFFSTTASVDFHRSLLQHLNAHGKSVLPSALFCLHGSMPQVERTAHFSGFKKATEGILLTTNIAARGLDFPAVDTVVQYDPAGEVEDYVHRVGRAGRMGQIGESLLFLQPHELPFVQSLKAKGVMLKSSPLGTLLDSLPGLSQPTEGYSRKDRNHQAQAGEMHPLAVAMDKRVEAAVLQHEDLGKLAAEGCRAFSRAYATFPKSLKPIFHPKALHLGHVARSFGLPKPPSNMNKQISQKLAAGQVPTGRLSQKTLKDMKIAKLKANKKHSDHIQKASNKKPSGSYNTSAGKAGRMFTSE